MKLKALLVAAALAAGAALLASCETMSAEQCAAADWGALGYSDAAGAANDRFAARAQSCADKGIQPDQSAYYDGFANGMRAFCTPEHGFQFARNGGSFGGTCAADLAEDFAYAYADGRRVHDAQSEVDTARSQISSIESRRSQIDEDLRDRENSLREATTDEERQHRRDQIDDLRRRRREANEDLRVANDALPRLLRNLDSIRAEIGGRYGPW